MMIRPVPVRAERRTASRILRAAPVTTTPPTPPSSYHTPTLRIRLPASTATVAGVVADLGGRPSRTAVLTAVARAVHREEPPPWVLDDDLALDLADVEGLALRERLRAEV